MNPLTPLPLILCILAGVGTAQSLYVDATLGADTNPGTLALPLRTIDGINSHLAPGATVYFKRGESFSVSAMSLAPLTISQNGVHLSAYGTGPAPIINGQDFASAILIAGADYVTIQDLTIQNGGNQNGIEVTGDTNGLLVYQTYVIGGQIGIAAPAPGNPSGNGNQVTASLIAGQVFDGLSIHGSIHFDTVSSTYAFIGATSMLGGAGDGCSSHDTATIGAYGCLFYENLRGAMVNINTQGTNYLVNCVVKATNASSLVRQDGTGQTDVVSSKLILTGTTSGVGLLTIGGGTIHCAWSTITVDNPLGFGFASAGTLSLYNCRSEAYNGASHGGLAGSGIFFGDFNTYTTTGMLWSNSGVPLTFSAWQALTGADLNSLGASG